jgi:hypothetical protein
MAGDATCPAFRRSSRPEWAAPFPGLQRLSQYLSKEAILIIKYPALLRRTAGSPRQPPTCGIVSYQQQRFDRAFRALSRSVAGGAAIPAAGKEQGSQVLLEPVSKLSGRWAGLRC